MTGLTDTPRSHAPGVERWNCSACGSPIAARFDYLPGQIYVPLGIFDQPDLLPPDVVAFASNALDWITLPDDLAFHDASSRDTLNDNLHRTPPPR